MMSRKFNQLGLVLIGGLLLIAFQNCGPMQMNPDFASLDSLTDVRSGPGGQLVSVPPTMITIPDDDRDQIDDTPDHQPSTPSDASATHYVCVIAVAGQSHKVSLVGGRLEAQTSTPDTVCMTKNACLEIVARELPVLSVERRGYCLGEASKPRARVVHLNDQAISRLMN